MKTDLPDVNVLVALHVDGHPHGDRARAWLVSAEGVVVTPLTQAGLRRMLLNPTINAGLAPAAANDVVADLLAVPGVVNWPDDTANVAKTPFMYALTGHRQVSDLHLLSLAASRGGRLVTFDKRIKA
ncbi:MAG: PIN domain-containing protein, partial [Bifidobacteriaceae bacterium]|nr:PIN domain-containing protein [Bifidobacteriaceae bacterium]